jgi:hypothetical protein
LHGSSFPQFAAGENDRDVGPVFEYPSAQADAIHLARHSNITENQVHKGARFLEDRYGVGGAFCLDDLKTVFFEMQGKPKPDDGLVFYDQNDLPVSGTPTFNDFLHALTAPPRQ